MGFAWLRGFVGMVPHKFHPVREGGPGEGAEWRHRGCKSELLLCHARGSWHPVDRSCVGRGPGEQVRGSVRRYGVSGGRARREETGKQMSARGGPGTTRGRRGGEAFEFGVRIAGGGAGACARADVQACRWARGRARGGRVDGAWLAAAEGPRGRGGAAPFAHASLHWHGRATENAPRQTLRESPHDVREPATGYPTFNFARPSSVRHHCPPGFAPCVHCVIGSWLTARPCPPRSPAPRSGRRLSLALNRYNSGLVTMAGYYSRLRTMAKVRQR